MNPNRGAWLEYETDSNDVFYVRIDKNRKIPVTVLILRALGLGTDAADPSSSSAMTSAIEATLDKDTTNHRGRGPAGDLPQAAPRRAPHGGERPEPLE